MGTVCACVHHDSNHDCVCVCAACGCVRGFVVVCVCVCVRVRVSVAAFACVGDFATLIVQVLYLIHVFRSSRSYGLSIPSLVRHDNRVEYLSCSV